MAFRVGVCSDGRAFKMNGDVGNRLSIRRIGDIARYGDVLR